MNFLERHKKNLEWKGEAKKRELAGYLEKAQKEAEPEIDRVKRLDLLGQIAELERVNAKVQKGNPISMYCAGKKPMIQPHKYGCVIATCACSCHEGKEFHPELIKPDADPTDMANVRQAWVTKR